MNFPWKFDATTIICGSGKGKGVFDESSILVTSPTCARHGSSKKSKYATPKEIITPA